MKLSEKYAAARDKARESCIRSTCFLGLGIHSTQDDSAQTSVLAKEIGNARLPDGIKPEDFDSFQSDYKSWVISHGLKELVDGLSTYFDQVYECTMIASKGGRIDADSANRIKTIREKDLLGKLRTLRTDFGIESDHSRQLTTIYKAYDCLCRFQGKVSERYYNAAESMQVSWCVISSKKSKTKEKQFLIREKKFKTGKYISFKIKELLAIGIFACLFCDSIYASAMQIDKARGLSDEKP